MKKIILFLFTLLPASGFAQIFPATQRSMVTEDGVFTCAGCYTWALPAMNYLKGIYGDSLITWHMEHRAFKTALSKMIGGWVVANAFEMPLGVSIVSPFMYVNQQYVSELGGDAVFKAEARHKIDSMNARTTLASPIFTEQKIGTDSMVVVTKVKFLQPANGEYHISVILLQDSIWYQQAGAPGGYCYHMAHLSGPEPEFGTWSTTYNGNDSISYTMANGPIAVNTIFTDTFRFKLDTFQKIKQMRAMAIVWKYDTVSMYDVSDSTWTVVPKFRYVNANEKPGFYNKVGIEPHAVPEMYVATVYPNPAVNRLHVKLLNVEEGVTLKVYDVSGREVLSSAVADGADLDVSKLTGGQYIYNFVVRGHIIAQGKVEIM